jgi:hypothetical protein
MLDICGALFGLAALSILPISIAQPIFCNGLVRGEGSKGVLGVCGALFGLAALSILPISIAQPIFCNGLVRGGLLGRGAGCKGVLLYKG